MDAPHLPLSGVGEVEQEVCEAVAGHIRGTDQDAAVAIKIAGGPRERVVVGVEEVHALRVGEDGLTHACAEGVGKTEKGEVRALEAECCRHVFDLPERLWPIFGDGKDEEVFEAALIVITPDDQVVHAVAVSVAETNMRSVGVEEAKADAQGGVVKSGVWLRLEEQREGLCLGRAAQQRKEKNGSELFHGVHHRDKHQKQRVLLYNAPECAE